MPGKVIVITGANGGLGRALAQGFAEAGDRVVLLGRALSKVQEVAGAIGDRALAIQCEVSSPDSVRAAFKQIAETYGEIDALINNAAIFQQLLIEEASDDQIINAVMINLAGPMLCARSAIPLLGAGGNIINVSSESIDVTLPHLTPYQASKAGLEQFTRDLNLELYDKGIRVSTVRCGQMMGPGFSAEADPVAGARFFEEAMRRGHRVLERGFTQYASTVRLFRTIVEAPADMYIGAISFQARPTA